MTSAVRFLRHPSVRNSSARSRIAFLEKKGLTSGEIVEALRRVDPNGAVFRAVSTGVSDGLRPSEAVDSMGTAVLSGTEGPDAGGPGVFGDPVAQAERISQLSAQINELTEAQQSSSSWWGFLAPAALLLALGAGLSYLVQEYIPKITITIGDKKVSGGAADDAETGQSRQADAPSDTKSRGGGSAAASGRRRRPRNRGARRFGGLGGGGSGAFDSDEYSDADSEVDPDGGSGGRFAALDATLDGKGPQPNVVTKEDFQRLKSEIDHLTDEITINSEKNMNVLSEIREMKEALLAIRNAQRATGGEGGSGAPTSGAGSTSVGGLSNIASPIASPGGGDISAGLATPVPVRGGGGGATGGDGKQRAQPRTLEAAMARMRGSASGAPKVAVQSLKFFLTKILEHPDDTKLHVLNKSNAMVRKILEVDGAEAFLLLSGFEQDQYCFRPQNQDRQAFEARARAGMAALERFDEAPAPAGTGVYAAGGSPVTPQPTTPQQPAAASQTQQSAATDGAPAASAEEGAVSLNQTA